MSDHPRGLHLNLCQGPLRCWMKYSDTIRELWAWLFGSFASSTTTDHLQLGKQYIGNYESSLILNEKIGGRCIQILCLLCEILLHCCLINLQTRRKPRWPAAVIAPSLDSWTVFRYRTVMSLWSATAAAEWRRHTLVASWGSRLSMTIICMWRGLLIE